MSADPRTPKSTLRVSLPVVALLALLVLLLGPAAPELGPTPASAHTRITTDLNWSEDIRPLFRQHCMRCHSPNGIAPSYVDLTTYGTDSAPGARAWAVAIQEELLTGRMPPWGADERYDRFSNSRAITQLEIDMIVAWVEGGAPQGPRRDLPPPPEFTTDPWELGQPDVVLELPEVFVLPADREQDSTRVTVPIEIEEDTWVTAFEFRPDVPSSVFRAAAWIVDPETAPESLEVEVQVPYDPFADEDAPEPTRMREMPQGRRFLGQWVRGDAPVLLPDGAGKRLRQGSSIELLVEYRRSPVEGVGQELRDRTRLGLFLAQTPDEVDLIVEQTPIATERIEVRKRDIRKRRPVVTATTLDEHSRLIGLSPRLPDSVESYEIRAVYPDGRDVVLAYVPDYDPKWASSYRLAEQLDAPSGTRIEVAALFEEEPSADAPFEVWVDYAIDDHLVLPEPVEVAANPAQNRGGMMVGIFGDEGGDMPPGMPPGAPAPNPADPNAAAHMDHSPLHGGQFFMAANMYHHLEGALPEPGEFRLYVYDDFKKPVDPRNFGGDVVFEHYDPESGEFSETRYPLEPAMGTDYLVAEIPPEMPTEFFASVWLAGEQNRYDFYFEEPTVDTGPVTRLPAVTGTGAHSHERPPLTIPGTPEGIAQEIVARGQRVLQQIDTGEFVTLYVPAFDARDLAEALLERLDGLSPRDLGAARRAITRILQGAGELDRAGDLADEGRARQAYERFAEGVRVLEDIFL